MSIAAIAALLSAAGAGAVVSQVVTALLSRRLRNAQAAHEEANTAGEVERVLGSLVDRLDARVLIAEERADMWRAYAVELEHTLAEKKMRVSDSGGSHLPELGGYRDPRT